MPYFRAFRASERQRRRADLNEGKMEIEIKALTPDFVEDYIDFFDHRAFSDGSPYYPCYCNAFNMSAIEIDIMREQAKHYGGGVDGWQRSLRESAAQMVKEGRIHGFLAFDNEIAIGWCNANDRMNYYRVGEFDLDQVPKDPAPINCQRERQIKSIVCFEISPEYRGKGIATQLLNRVCSDALAEGYEYVEAYPSDQIPLPSQDLSDYMKRLVSQNSHELVPPLL